MILLTKEIKNFIVFKTLDLIMSLTIMVFFAHNFYMVFFTDMDDTLFLRIFTSIALLLILWRTLYILFSTYFESKILISVLTNITTEEAKSSNKKEQKEN